MVNVSLMENGIEMKDSFLGGKPLKFPAVHARFVNEPLAPGTLEEKPS